MLKKIKNITRFVSIWVWIVAVLIIILPSLFLSNFEEKNKELNEQNINLNQETKSYSDIVNKYALEYNIPKFVPVIDAIIMQESSGKGQDPMQSSESAYNTDYKKAPNSITDPDYSIKTGVNTLAHCLTLANCNEPSDINSLSLALQGYNFGEGYITWAMNNYGGYSEENALEFSKSKGEKYGDAQYVNHVLRYCC